MFVWCDPNRVLWMAMRLTTDNYRDKESVVNSKWMYSCIINLYKPV